MPRYRDTNDYYEDEDVPGGRDALINELGGTQTTDPFAGLSNGPSAEDIPVETADQQDDYSGAGGIPFTPGDQTDFFTQSPGEGGVTSNPASAASYAYGGPWAGFDANSMAGGASDRTAGNGKYFFTTVAQKYDPWRTHTDRAYAEQMLAELNKNPYGIQYSLSNENDFMARTPGEAYDGAYMGGRPMGYDQGAPWDENNQDWQWQWLSAAGNPAAQQTADAGGYIDPSRAALISSLGGSANAANGTSGAAGTTTPVTGTNGTGMNDSIRSYIERIMGKDPYAVNADDPAFRAASDAYRLSQNRSLQRNREAMAERMAASGTMGGGFDSWLGGAMQNMGENQAGYDAKLVLDRQQQQLSQLENALKVGAGLLTADQEAQVKLKIADLQKAIADGQLGYQYYNANLGNQQFYDNLSYLLAALQINGNNMPFNNPVWG